MMLVERPEWVLLEFTDYDGHNHKLSFTDLVGRVCLHEMDHLEGILISDKAKERMKFSQIEKQEDFLKFIEKNIEYIDLLAL